MKQEEKPEEEPAMASARAYKSSIDPAEFMALLAHYKRAVYECYYGQVFSDDDKEGGTNTA